MSTNEKTLKSLAEALETIARVLKEAASSPVPSSPEAASVGLLPDSDEAQAIAAFIEGDNTTRRIFRAANEVFASNGMNTKVYGWTGACGFLLKANECFDCNVKTMGEGVRLFLEQQNKEKMRRGMNPIAAMLGIAGCECEECED